MNKKSKPASQHKLKQRERRAPRRPGQAKKTTVSETALPRPPGLTFQEIAALPPASKKLQDWIRAVDLQQAQVGGGETRLNPALSPPTAEAERRNYSRSAGYTPAGIGPTGIQHFVNELRLMLFQWAESQSVPAVRKFLPAENVSTGTIVRQPDHERREPRAPLAAHAAPAAQSDCWPRIPVRYFKSKKTRIRVVLDKPVSPP